MDTKAVCPAKPGEVRCFARVAPQPLESVPTSSLAPPYGPREFHSAYNVPTTSRSTDETIAVVVAYDAPWAKHDLNVYNHHFGLPDFPRCNATVTTACFERINQDGNKAWWPAQDLSGGWQLETDLDVQTAHMMCVNCKILLVEANSPSFVFMPLAVKTAVEHGADVVSNSWGAGEHENMTSDYDFPGVAMAFASGDYGSRGGAMMPASSGTVTAVGGTRLALNADGSRHSEKAWIDSSRSGSSSGCSTYVGVRRWQRTLGEWNDTGCGSHRGVADVAADADPDTGAAIYISHNPVYEAGWYQLGGTSLAAPLVAGIYGLAADSQTAYRPAILAYQNAAALRDIRRGRSSSCDTTICKAAPGYDGPTGLGVPNGLTGF